MIGLNKNYYLIRNGVDMTTQKIIPFFKSINQLIKLFKVLVLLYLVNVVMSSLPSRDKTLQTCDECNDYDLSDKTPEDLLDEVCS